MDVNKHERLSNITVRPNRTDLYFTHKYSLIHCKYKIIKTMFSSSLPTVVYRRARTLFTLFVYSGCPTHIVLCFCLVFPCLVYPMLPVSLDCRFLITSSLIYYTVLLKQKKRPILDITGFFFPMSTQVKAEVRCIAPMPSTEYECRKRNPLYPIQATSFVSIVMYLTSMIMIL